MGQCLKVQLKEVVNNDNLLILGALKLRVKSAENPTNNQRKLTLVVTDQGSETVTVKSLGPMFTWNGDDYQEKSFTNSNGTVILYFVNGDYDIIIENKYGLLTFQTDYNSIFSTSLDDCYMSGATIFMLSSLESSVGTIENIKLKQDANTLVLTNNYSVVGDINALLPYSGLVVLFLQRSGISGDAHAMFSAWSAAGRTSNLTFVGNGIIAINGTVYANGVSKTISFDGQGGYTVA